MSAPAFALRPECSHLACLRFLIWESEAIPPSQRAVVIKRDKICQASGLVPATFSFFPEGQGLLKCFLITVSLNPSTFGIEAPNMITYTHHIPSLFAVQLTQVLKPC